MSWMEEPKYLKYPERAGHPEVPRYQLEEVRFLESLLAHVRVSLLDRSHVRCLPYDRGGRL